MRGLVAILGVLAGCAARHGAPADRRCVLRLSYAGTFVDGEPRSRADAVAACTRAPGGAVVVIERDPRPVPDAVIVHDARAIETEWAATKLALERARVRIYVRGELCPGIGRADCRPLAPVQHEPPIQPRRIIEPDR